MQIRIRNSNNISKLGTGIHLPTPMSRELEAAKEATMNIGVMPLGAVFRQQGP